jgi:hypothetical protein
MQFNGLLYLLSKNRLMARARQLDTYVRHVVVSQPLAQTFDVLLIVAPPDLSSVFKVRLYPWRYGIVQAGNIILDSFGAGLSKFSSSSIVLVIDIDIQCYCPNTWPHVSLIRDSYQQPIACCVHA